MEQLYNIYCDESCHLQKDHQPIMVLGAIWCPQKKIKEISSDLLELKRKNNACGELKWTKVSPAKKDFYFELVNYFFKKTELNFRCLIVKNKSKLDHKAFNQNSHDTFYYKMYFSLLNKILDPINKYNIYLDIKDTRSNLQVKNLRTILCNNFYDFTGEMIEKIQQVRSNESRILQLGDFLIGTVAYKNRELDKDKTKGQIVDFVEGKLGNKLNISTSLSKKKFNIFIFSPQQDIQ